PLTQHVLTLAPTGKIIADAEAQPGVFLGADERIDAGQPIVAAGATLGPDADGAERQGQVVGDHQEAVHRNVLLVQPVAYRLAAEVHVRAGLDQHERAALVPELRAIAIAGRREDHPGHLGQRIEHLEADVVPCADIFRPGIAQAHDQVFHGAQRKRPPTWSGVFSQKVSTVRQERAWDHFFLPWAAASAPSSFFFVRRTASTTSVGFSSRVRFSNCRSFTRRVWFTSTPVTSSSNTVGRWAGRAFTRMRRMPCFIFPPLRTPMG